KIVTNATIRPPMAPGITSPKARSGAVVLRFHVQAAVAIAQISSTPVLLIVPFKVMVWPNAAPSPRNVLSFKAGLEVFINAMNALLASGGTHRELSFRQKHVTQVSALILAGS